MSVLTWPRAGVRNWTRPEPLFHPVLEVIVLFIPWAFFVAFGAMTAFGYDWTPARLSSLNFLTTYVFLDITHTGFTILLFTMIPEGRQFVASAIAKRRLWLPLGLGLFLVFPILLTQLWGGPRSMNNTMANLLFMVLQALWLQHSVSQVFGISMLYNRRDKVPEDVQSEERRLFNILIYASVTSPFLSLLEGSAYRAALAAYLAVATVIVILLLRNSWRRSPSPFKVTFFYQTRLLFWLGAGLHPLFMSGVMAYHAFEYLMIWQLMVKNSAFKKTWWAVGGLVVIAFLAYPFLRWSLYQSPHQLAFGLVYLTAVARALDYFHYYADGIIFRFRDPEARRLIGPLLATEKT